MNYVKNIGFRTFPFFDCGLAWLCLLILSLFIASANWLLGQISSNAFVLLVRYLRCFLFSRWKDLRLETKSSQSIVSLDFSALFLAFFISNHFPFREAFQCGLFVPGFLSVISLHGCVMIFTTVLYVSSAFSLFVCLIRSVSSGSWSL